MTSNAVSSVKFTLTELRSEAQRELLLRNRVYPNRVLTGTLSQVRASRQISMMAAIVQVLSKLEAEEKLI